MCFRVVLVALIVVLPLSSGWAECSQQDAFQKMMALGVAKSDIQKKMNALPNGNQRNSVMQKWASLGQEIAAVGKLLGAQKYGLACSQYDQIATKHSLNMDELVQRAPKLDQLK